MRRKGGRERRTIGVKALFEPVDVDLCVDALLGQLDGVRDVEGHVAVNHEREAGRGREGEEVSWGTREKEVEVERTRAQRSLGAS